MDVLSATLWRGATQYLSPGALTSDQGTATLFLLPLTFSCFSVTSLIASLLWQACRSRTAEDITDETGQSRSWTQSCKAHMESYGGSVIYTFLVARLCGVVCLLFLTLLSPPLVHCEHQRIYPLEICFQPVLITFLFLTITAVISLTSKRLSRSAIWQTNAILLLVLAIYIYRDVWPLATYDLQPEDIDTGNILWAKIALLVFVGVVIPMSIPQVYDPVDPKNPIIPPPRELTDSWISKLLFCYIGPVVSSASKVSHLAFDQLPPLLDVDKSSYITGQAFPYVDPSITRKRRNIVWGLLWYFRNQLTAVALAYVFCSVCQFAGPVSIVKILGYIETGGENATTRPWLWVVLFLVGSSMRSILSNWAFYIESVLLVRMHALLTQLVFEHSLRIRLKAETAKANTDSSHSTPRSTSPLQEEDKTKPAAPHGGDTENLVGRIQNLVTSDLKAVVDGSNILYFVVSVPFTIIFCIAFLAQILGWSAVVSLTFILGLGPVGTFIVKKLRKVMDTKMKATDARVQMISEAISIIRMVKLFGWESKLFDRIRQRREEELGWIWQTSVLNVATKTVSDLIPTIAMFATYATYTVIMKEELSPSKIFSSISVLNMLRSQIAQVSFQASRVVQVKVSLDRFTVFLNDTELLDEFAEPVPVGLSVHGRRDNQVIGFKDATFTWTASERDRTVTPSSRRFKLLIKGEIIFKHDCINMIIGPTGSGKTSLLMALLGEMHFIPPQADSWFNLPREGKVAYAAQESWIQSTTIKDNILFGMPYNQERYAKVINECALEQDLELFKAGDNTEVGEKGLTLSGGQKARVSLARAMYSDAQILLLDDILAALDVHTAAWIVNKCFRGDLVKGRTILLVTHNTLLVGPIAGHVISLDASGRVQAQETNLYNVQQDDPKCLVEENEESVAPKDTPETTATKPPTDGKLFMSEEIIEGHIRWRSMKLYLSAMSQNHPIPFLLLLFVLYSAFTAVAIGQTWFLGVWGAQYKKHAPAEVKLYLYLSGFALIVTLHAMMSCSVYIFVISRKIHASRIIHAELIHSILGSTFRWLDETPTGRIIARCTQDIGSVDGSIPQYLTTVIEVTMLVVLAVGGIILFTPIFIFPCLVVGIAGTLLGKRYLKAQLSIKREMSNAKSPVLSHFNTTMHGLVSIRAYGARHIVKEESLERIDHYTRIARTSWNLNRWFSLRMDLFGALFISLLSFYLLYVKTNSASVTGFSLNMAVVFCTWIFFLVQFYNELEVECNSLERIQGYLDIDHEQKHVQGGNPPASWPTSGDLVVDNLSARYSSTGPRVLHNLSFRIKSGEHIGIVGRTGSGKSSLTLSLLRCIPTEGTVCYDGVPTHTMNLDALRSNITIIPQIPELISGTLRQNVDPFDQYDDAVLNEALGAAGLFSLQEEAETGEGYLSLDSNISSSGNNLSVGQRQIIALARAMVRGSKLLILDEATSAIDYRTDAIIQRSLRTQVPPDTTVITIAHRLQTIMDADRIMVLDKGRIVEFDSPANLQMKDGSVFKTLVNGSEDQRALHELIGGTGTS